MKWVEHVACMRELRNAYKISVGKPEGTTWEARHKWEDNIIMDLKRILWEGVD
jgi:hypothetical protein